ncbi:PB1 domain-containing protein [Cephalotus follicularis]|uniref:PB1 domain-containing protein n=1 Tax=Cephalotus follicularis TaxID=3775 RepID=A0A1Q3BHQ7_CEPFO|nr:PB1 domain-containing protein [Cephalotus follicularis]
MTLSHRSELDSAATDSVTSSPRSEHHAPNDLHTRVRFMCSFGGKILPRPHDNQLRYVGGDTRIVAVHRATNFSTFITKLSKLSGISDVSVKYQLPNEDLDALISVTTDEDVENMMEEYDRCVHNHNPRSARLRLFLFSKGDDSGPSSISSLLDGSANRENWFFDALNGGLERGRSEVSSIVSEVPDYLLGLDNSDDSKLKTRSVLPDNVSVSDPGSPGPVTSSIPDLPPVKTKPDNPTPAMVQLMDLKQNQMEGFMDSVVEQPISKPSGYSYNPPWPCLQDSHYPGAAVQQLPVYYVPGPVQPVSAPTGHPVPIQAQYVQQYSVPAGQIPARYHQTIGGVGQVYGGAVVPVVPLEQPYDVSTRVVSDGLNQQMYYGFRNAGPVPGYHGGEELQRTWSDVNKGRFFDSS